MRFILTSFVAATVVANESCDQKEQVSMLQTKDRLGLAAKEFDLIKAVDDASPMFESDAQVNQFLDGVKKTVDSIKEADGKEALLQRASQSKQMQELIGRFHSLPVENQQKLTKAGGDIFEKLPVAQRSALVQQVSHSLDDATEGKTETRQFEDATGRKCTQTTDDRGYLHRHCHGDTGTETTSRAKTGGHFHNHKYDHNGQGGNARTSTFSEGGGHRHEHQTAHVSDANGNTATSTHTESEGGGNKHEHSHSTWHANGKTHTGTVTSGTAGNHHHQHND